MIQYTNDNSTAEIDSVTDLSIEQAIELKKKGITKVRIFADNHPDELEKPNEIAGDYQREPYDIDTYIAIRGKLNELIEGIDISKSDEEKFAIIYSRICKNIVYDYPAAYPIGPSERKYEKDSRIKCRNLLNGLLEGKCVCAGYADILRSALELVGIDACFISGPIIGERKIQNKIINKYKSLKGKSVLKEVFKKRIDKLKNPKIDYHAWVKVKIDGNWYNADPTWDADNIRNGLSPIFALQTDAKCKSDKKSYNPGPKCVTEFPNKKINKLFGGNNLYIGNKKIPNLKDLKGMFTFNLNLFSKLGKILFRSMKGFGESVMLGLKGIKEKLILPNGTKTMFPINQEKTDDYKVEFEKECGYTIDNLKKMGFTDIEIERFQDSFNSKTGERLDRVGIVKKAIEKKKLEKKPNAEIESAKSWDLSRWGINKKSFQTKNIIKKPIKRNDDKERD